MNADDVFNDFLQPKDGGGRGRKQCPECGEYVGVRSFNCKNCDYKFTNKKTKEEIRREADAATEEERLYAMCIGANGGRLVYAPRGCPSAQLVDITYDAIVDYCEMVVYEGKQSGCIMTVRAIKHYIQHQFGYNSEEYRQAAAFVSQWYDRKMGIDTPSGNEYNEGV